ncbi:acyltransferase [Rhizobium sp. ARZ01]|uniref:acyltransferase n=1 Tax=Rhizobium sp. ARZ01 TaxID=2769313 RepID=UPI00177F9129|nr:acyltransferase [Rhizobium sp. ARZ01]MBD9372123.1 acyltransferase [Rhizobium sp. ARZ01]
MARIVKDGEIAGYSDDKGNRIIGVPAFADRFEVSFAGSNNELHIGQRANLTNTRILFDSSNSKVSIGDHSIYRGVIRASHGGCVHIGKRLVVTLNCYISAFEGQTVTIGDDCMFATNNEIRTDDAHPIFDRRTGARLNKSKSVTIGNHVWLAAQTAVWKGADIGDGCMIGRNSFVNSAIPPHCLAAGTPASVIREEIVWDRTHLGMTAPYAYAHSSELPKPVWGDAPSTTAEEPPPVGKPSNVLFGWIRRYRTAAAMAALIAAYLLADEVMAIAEIMYP